MEPESQAANQDQPSAEAGQSLDMMHGLTNPSADAPKANRLRRLFMASDGLRVGWAVPIFIALTILFVILLSVAVGMMTGHKSHGRPTSLSPFAALASEAVLALAAAGAAAIMARLEHRNILDYNLRGSRGFAHFVGGLTAGFAALSALVGALAWGGWLHFGGSGLVGAHIVGFGALWAVVFLCTGIFEEGSFRCYLQFTFTRGINFWWALAIIAALCLDLALRAKGNGVWGVYVMALLGVVPCLALHLKGTPGSSFWQAAWVTSTLFGFVHTSNHGENWIGIFAAGAIGFVFCVSVWLTGSAWWAIGCHAAWDWSETFFYGAADSGLVAKGHFLTTNPAGNAFWSGGTDGPEGSALILGALVLLMLILLVVYGRSRTAAAAEGSAAQAP